MVAQFGQMNNVLISLAVALLAYYANLLAEKNFTVSEAHLLLKGALILLLGSIAAGLVCGLLRLANARTTTQVAKYRNEAPEKAAVLRAVSEIQVRLSRMAIGIEVGLFGVGAAVGIAAVYWQFG